jgi:hypothetical protein
MIDRDGLHELFGRLASDYIVWRLGVIVGVIAAWLTPRVRNALEWLHARLRSRDVTVQAKGWSLSTSMGVARASVTPPRGTRSALPMIETPPGMPAGTASAIATALGPSFTMPDWMRRELAARPLPEGRVGLDVARCLNRYGVSNIRLG